MCLIYVRSKMVPKGEGGQKSLKNRPCGLQSQRKQNQRERVQTTWTNEGEGVAQMTTTHLSKRVYIGGGRHGAILQPLIKFMSLLKS